jgi:peroxiredoxin
MLCLIGAAIIVAWAGLPDRGLYSAGPEVGALAPAIEGQAVDGEPVSLKGWRGQPVVVNFWATWCAPCLEEMPALQAAARSRPDVRFVGVNAGEPVAAIRQWAEARGLEFPLMADGDGSLVRAYQVRGLPATFFIDSAGVIREVVYGPLASGQVMENLGP